MRDAWLCDASTAGDAEAALQIGATREQIVETVLQLTFYAGGPAVRNALIVLKEVFAQTT
ncbi:carboxymuconolactone decarboxylase family protein [Pandoraea sp.]|uniref:carboxymuconolactone decarboxylase family protein n=1 Tax=Pandoraea sp. TaxID=1883445 RepID=UPI0025CF4676|nr:carboxymuconolactone decarboxylase family protein [Pandoraea sp.]